MPLVIKSLPRARLRMRDIDLDSEVTGSVEIFTSVTLAARLRQETSFLLANGQQLWIASNSCCRIKISVMMDDEFICGKGKVSQLINWIQECTVWSQLGLRIRYCGGLSTIIASDLTFMIQHPDLSSSIVAPSAALTADFKLASCCVHLGTMRHPPNRKQRRRTKSIDSRHSDNSKKRKSMERLEIEDGDDAVFYHDLDTTDKEVIDNFVLTNEQSELAQGSRYIQEHSPIKIQFEGIIHILQASLSTFIGGSSKMPGVQVLESKTCLASIAPGVFNLPFLQAVCQRAPLVSVIASSLAYMGKAESPSLRRKMESLQLAIQDGDPLPDSESSTSNTYNLFQCLEAQTWSLMLSKLKAAKIAQAKVKAPRNTDKDAETFSLSPTSSRYIDEFLSSRQDDTEDRPSFLDVDEADPIHDASGDRSSMSFHHLDAVYSADVVQSQIPYADIYSPIYESHSLSSFLQPSFYLTSANTTADMMEITH